VHSLSSTDTKYSVFN